MLFVAAFVVRALAATLHADPAYPDSFYYVNVARALARGDGFSVDYVWNFVDVGGRLPANPTLPIPSNGHWMPLAELVQVPFVWLLGETALAAALPFWILGAAVAPVTYWIGRDAGLPRIASIAGGVLVALPLGTTPFLVQPDNFALFMLLGAVALWICARAVTGRENVRLLYAAGGLVVGLATLSRNDGVLLGIPFALAFVAARVREARARREPPGPASRIDWTAALLCATAFLVVVGPWFARQLAVFGSLAPSAANGRILWITDYQQLFSVSTETTLASFLAQGPGSLLASRVRGLIDALKWFAIAPLLVFLVPPLLAGAWRHRRNRAFWPWFLYAGTLFAFSAALFAVHVDHGTFLHSAVALVPHAYLLCAAGVGVLVETAARRLRHWDAPRATRNFTVIVLVVAALGTAGGTYRVASAWSTEREVRGPLYAAVAAAPPGDRVMSPDPGAYRYYAGRGGIITPNDPIDVVERALTSYGIRWLVVERDYILPAFVPILTGDSRPPWLSGPLVVVPDPPDAVLELDPRLEGAPLAALYAVCFEPADTRCR